MVNFEMIKNEIIKNGGITLINNKKMNYKNGYIVSVEGYEYTTKDLNDAINTLVNYGKNNKIVGVWYDNGLYYVDVNKYFNIKQHKQAINEGIKNNQKAIYNIHKRISEYLKQYYYTIYKVDTKNNDFINIIDFTSLKDTSDFLNVKLDTIKKAISKTLDNIKRTIKINGVNYIIIKELDNIY